MTARRYRPRPAAAWHWNGHVHCADCTAARWRTRNLTGDHDIPDDYGQPIRPIPAGPDPGTCATCHHPIAP